MKKACLVVQSHCLKNKIFDRYDFNFNRDDCLAIFYHLKKEFLKINIDLSTQDINKIEESDIVIYNEMPKRIKGKFSNQKKILFILESPLIVKNSWDMRLHNFFDIIFTWNDDYIDNEKYFKMNYTYELPKTIPRVKARKLCTIIAGHKKSIGKKELYSERINMIRLLEEKTPENFDLFGIGWDEPAFSSYFKIFKIVPFLRFSPFFKKFNSYRGRVENKQDILKNYNFAICYENIKDLNGYITEKIFDCLFAGTIPIYWGACNVETYIPRNCFIDRREFASDQDVLDYILSLSENEIQIKRKNISNFLNSEKIEQFSAQYTARYIAAKVEGMK